MEARRLAVGVSLKSGCGSGLEVRHNHIQTRVTLNEDCISTGEAAAKRSLESCAAGVRALPR